MAASPRAVKLTIENSVAASNTGSGIDSDGALATIRISNVTVADSGQYGLIASRGPIISFGNNRITGSALGDLAPGLTLTAAGQQ